jgi:hypothetical protein
MKVTFRTGFFTGLIVAVGFGLYLLQLWDAENQVRLHGAHLLSALEDKDWSDVSEFVDPSYTDQWGHDRAVVLSLLQQVLPYANHLHLHAPEVVVRAANGEGEWSARVTLEADPNEVSTILRERINVLDEPFKQEWRRVSWKPWDWKLVRVTNPALEIPAHLF